MVLKGNQKFQPHEKVKLPNGPLDPLEGRTST